MLSRRTALMGALGASASFGPIAQTQNPPPDSSSGLVATRSNWPEVTERPAGTHKGHTENSRSLVF